MSSRVVNALHFARRSAECDQPLPENSFIVVFYHKTVWPSGLRRWLKAPVRKGVGSNPTAVILQGGASGLGGVSAGPWGTLTGHMV